MKLTVEEVEADPEQAIDLAEKHGEVLIFRDGKIAARLVRIEPEAENEPEA
jgi:hypothetical protein